MSIIYRPKGRAAEYSHLAINHFRGCGHGCKYCYVPETTKNKKFHIEQSIRKDVLWQLRREAPNYAGTDERVLLCFACDPYQPLNDTEHTTREVIKILKQWNIPFQVLTKGGTRAVADFDLYERCDAFAITLTFLEEKNSRKWEPYAALPADRIAAIVEAHIRGIETWISLEPVLDTKESLKIIEATHEFVDLYKIGHLNHYECNITARQWRRFGTRAIALCRDYKTDYFIKADLAKYLDGVRFHNVDTRKIKRPKQQSQKPEKTPGKQGKLFQ